MRISDVDYRPDSGRKWQILDNLELLLLCPSHWYVA